MRLISKNDIKEIIKNIDLIPLDKPIHYDLYLIHYAVMLNNIDLLEIITNKNSLKN